MCSQTGWPAGSTEEAKKRSREKYAMFRRHPPLNSMVEFRALSCQRPCLSGLVWPGLAWLEWPGLVWSGLAWSGLVWPGGL